MGVMLSRLLELNDKSVEMNSFVCGDEAFVFTDRSLIFVLSAPQAVKT